MIQKPSPYSVARDILAFLSKQDPADIARAAQEDEALFTHLFELGGGIAKKLVMSVATNGEDPTQPGCCKVDVGQNLPRCYDNMTQGACIAAFPGASWTAGACGPGECLP